MNNTACCPEHGRRGDVDGVDRGVDLQMLLIVVEKALWDFLP